MPESASQSKVRVWPNRNTLGLAAILLAMGYAGASQNNGAAYLLCFLLVSLVATSTIHAWANIRGLDLTVDSIPPVFAGEALQAPVALSSSLRREHFAVTVGQGKAPYSVKFDAVPATGAIRGSISIPTERRGRFTEVRISMESIFPLGFLTARKVITVPQVHYVYPALRGSLPLPRSNTPTLQTKGGQRTAGDDFGGVRAWLPGESQRHIDWKAAARGQPLLTKQWAGEIDEILRLDWAALGDLGIGSKLSQLARWVVQSEKLGAQYELLLPNQKIPASRGDRHYHACLRALACFDEPAENRGSKTSEPSAQS